MRNNERHPVSISSCTYCTSTVSSLVTGLGNVFGENMLQGVAAGDTVKERKIADNLLSRHIETYFSGTIDYEQMQDRSQVITIYSTTVVSPKIIITHL